MTTYQRGQPVCARVPHSLAPDREHEGTVHATYDGLVMVEFARCVLTHNDCWWWAWVPAACVTRREAVAA